VIAAIGAQDLARAPVALVFSYEAAWVCAIQPQGGSFRFLELAFEWYSALRRAGIDVDIVAPGAELAGYKAVVIPSLPILPEGFAERLAALACPVLVGPRSGSKTASFCIPDGLPPGALRDVIPLTVTRVESLRDGAGEAGAGWAIERWREDVVSELAPEFALDDGRGVVFRHGHLRYCAAWPDRALHDLLVERIAREAGIATCPLPEGLRLRRSATHLFAFNYTANAIDTAPLQLGEPAIGEAVLPPAGVAVWPRAQSPASNRA
jgi:beta-galactosidase